MSTATQSAPRIAADTSSCPGCRELTRRVDALTATVDALTARRSLGPRDRHDDDARLVTAIAESIPDCVFSSAELFNHASVNEQLSQAFVSLNIRSTLHLVRGASISS